MRSLPNRLALIVVFLFSKLFFFMNLRLCRFEPTCSVYATKAFGEYGFFKAIGLVLRRLLRCHPFCAGGWDPLPAAGEVDGKDTSPAVL